MLVVSWKVILPVAVHQLAVLRLACCLWVMVSVELALGNEVGEVVEGPGHSQWSMALRDDTLSF